MSRFRVCAASAAVIAIALSATRDAHAQAAPAAPGQAGFQDNFFIQSADGGYRLQLGLLLQADDRFAIDDPQNDVVDAFTFRRIRPILQGRVAKYFDFYFNPDFAGGIVNIRDAYFDTRFSPAFRLRVGKGKTPFGLERLQGAANLTFVERGLPTAVAPDRDVGVQVLGDVLSGRVSYAAGVFNGVADGGSAEADTNDAKDVTGRIVVRPFPTPNGSTPLGGLALMIAGSSGRQPAVLPSFQSFARQTFFSYDRTAIGDGVRRRFSPQASYYYKAVGAFGEYVHSRGGVIRGAASADITHEAWTAAGSVVLTGETASDRGVKPKRPFDPAARTWGALQITARYDVLRVDPLAVALGFSAAGSSREARAVAAGVNWYLNANIKWVVNVERTVFDGDPDGVRHAESAILVRSQIAF